MYGIEVKNAQGRVVFNSSEPALHAIAKGTISTTFQGSHNHFFYHEGGGSFFTENFNHHDGTIPAPGVGEFLIFEITPGSQLYCLGGNPSFRPNNLIMTDMPQVNWVKAVWAKSLAPSSGFGIQVYDAQGNVTWSDSAPTLEIRGPLSNNNQSSGWFFFEHTGQYPDNRFAYRGIRRDSASSFTRRYCSPDTAGRDERTTLKDLNIRGFVVDVDFSTLNV